MNQFEVFSKNSLGTGRRDYNNSKKTSSLLLTDCQICRRMKPDNPKVNSRNLAAFWIFGVCNNFGYIVMITAAQDILNKQTRNITSVQSVEHCEPVLDSRHCSPHSASLVLLCNILPGLLAKISYPLIAKYLPYGVRHALVCILQATSLITVALSKTIPTALIGVMIGSIQSGLGEVVCLGLASHYPKNVVAFWSSGTGMAGLAGAFSYAGLTDPRLLGFSSSEAMLMALIVPFSFCIAYYFALQKPETVKQVSVLNPQAWIGLDVFIEKRKAKTQEIEGEIEPKKTPRTFDEKIQIMKSLLKYMIPLFIIYFSEYLSNQGLLELIIFDCDNGLGTSLKGQYRWYMTLYQAGVFVSRSSTHFYQLNLTWLAILPLLQLLNTTFFLFDSIYQFVPHFGIIAVIVFYEGLIGGAAYSNSYQHIHKNIEPSIKEFALSIVTLADTSGILVAALIAMPIHNFICTIPFY